MFRSKALLVVSLISLLALGACADATGPKNPLDCPITGGPGTCLTR